MPLSKNLALSSSAKELRALPNRGDSDAERLESAGRLLMEAIKIGAFDGAEFAGFRISVQQRFEQPKVNGYISAWCEAVWWLKGKPKGESPDLAAGLAEDVELVVSKMLKRSPQKKRRGRPSDTDHDEDRRISESWKNSGCKTFKEFAQTDAGQRFQKTWQELKSVHERHRKRESSRR